jgi:hypothetical protein
MNANAVFFAWNRPIPGREKISSAHFQDFVKFLTESQGRGAITSFDVMFLNNHGGDMNGFFLIRGEAAKLAEFVGSDEWTAHMMRASFHLENSGAVLGVTGDAVAKRFELWNSFIQS